MSVWPNTTVLRMLADEQYMGTYIQGRTAVREIGSGSVRRKDRSEWFILPDHHEPIVSRELFEAANAKIRRSPAPGKTPREYPLRGKVYCGYCAHAMSRVNGRWFVCPYRKGYGRPGCTGLSVWAEELEQIVLDSLRQQMAAALGMDTETNGFRVSSRKQAELEKQLQSIRQRKRELYEQFVTEKIPLDDFQAEKQRCDRDAQMLRNTLQMLAARQQEMQENQEASARFNALREEVLSSGSLTQAIAEKLIKKVTVYHDRQIEMAYAVQDFLKADGSALDVSYREVSTDLNPDQHWYTPDGTPVSDETVSGLIDDAKAIAWQELVYPHADGDTLTSVALDEATATPITLYAEDAPVLSLLIGGADSSAYYARLAGSSMVYKVASSSLTSLLNARPEDMLLSTLLPVSYENLLSATLTASGQTLTIVPEISDTSSEETEAAETAEATDAPAASPEPDPLVEAQKSLWALVAELSGEPCQDDGQEAELVLAIEAVNRNNISKRISIYAYDAEHYLARPENGASRLVSADAVDRIIRTMKQIH